MEGLNPLTGKCAKCGACTQVCPVFIETGRESHCPRGKLHLFTKGVDYSSEYFNSLLSKCIQCGACDGACPRDLQPSQIIRQLRKGQSLGQTPHGYTTFLARKLLRSKALLATASHTLPLLQKLPMASGLRQKISTLLSHENSRINPPKVATGQQTLAYYPGCLAQHFQTDIAKATRYLASLCGYTLDIPEKATCCGMASHCSGKEQEAQQQALLNMQAYAKSRGPILTSCGSCYSQLKRYPELFSPESSDHAKAITFSQRIQEFSTFFVNEAKLISPPKRERVYYHDPCHLRFGPHPILNEPRQLIWNLNGTPVVNQDEPLGCCGEGGMFAQVQPVIARNIFKRLQRKVGPTPQTMVVTTCSSCLMAWQQRSVNTTVLPQHLSVFLAKRCKNC